MGRRKKSPDAPFRRRGKFAFGNTSHEETGTREAGKVCSMLRLDSIITVA